jgi:hypothetical protein
VLAITAQGRACQRPLRKLRRWNGCPGWEPNSDSLVVGLVVVMPAAALYVLSETHNETGRGRSGDSVWTGTDSNGGLSVPPVKC